MIDLSTQLFGWLGIYGAMALAALGSMIGCARAGHAACGAMLDMESGHGRLIGIAAMPASQAIYGIVLTLALNRVVSADNAAPLAAIGLLGGLAQLVGAVKQGDCCASAIMVAKSRPEAFGLAIAPAAFVEGFTVFALAFALLLIGAVPGAAA
ncbi:MAG: ATP synthase subunit C [Sphingomonadales bacterium]|nr:MAG: ATP synthase subunit C [Sphingomonadales bacterium]